MKWIKCSEQEPPFNEYVIGWCTNHWLKGPIHAKVYCVDDEFYWTHILDGINKLCDEKEVSHWMPLPEPPEKE